MISRYYDSRMDGLLRPGRVLMVYGPRRVGKTTLVQTFLKSVQGRVFSGVGEDRLLRDVLESESVERIRSAFNGYDLIFIDEAQRIRQAGQALKMLVDHVPQARVIASGSSSFELAQQISAPLTGRQHVVTLYPVAAMELRDTLGPMEHRQKLESFLIYGSYPETLTAANDAERREYLGTLRDSYLCRDILELDSIRRADKLSDLLRLLAFQIGKDVSLNELGNALSLAKQTIERYLDLLEKCFVIRRTRAFSRNPRKEVAKSARYYFLDNGVRNAVINNFNPIGMRDDVGMLWENYLVTERWKKLAYTGTAANSFFWRTYSQAEIDLVEENDGQLHGYEFKWSDRKIKPPASWKELHPGAGYAVVNPDNYFEFIA